MAKINMSFDTITKQVLIDIDGKPLTNVDNLSVYRYNNGDETINELSLGLSQKTEDGMKIHTYVSAKKT